MLFNLASFVFFAAIMAPNAMAAPAVQPTAESLRLTQTLYSGILQAYISEGEQSYRPDFLLYRHYVQTLLNDWNQALEKSQITNTQEYWTSLQKRNTYLGRHFKVWQRIHYVDRPHIRVSEQINLGNQRLLFLNVLLRSETQKSFEQRLKLVFEIADIYFIQNSSDTELGLKILSAFLQHPDEKIRAAAQKSIESSPRFAKQIFTLIFARDMALLFSANPNTLLTATQVTAAKGAALTEKLSLAWQNIVKLWPMELLVKNPTLAAAGAVSVGIHAGIAFKPDFKNLPATRPFISELARIQSSSVLVLLALKSNLLQSHQTESENLLDFLPTTPPYSDRAAWIKDGVEYLKNPAVSSNFKWDQFILNGERLGGFWPDETQLTNDIVSQRLALTKTILRANQDVSVEGFRKSVIASVLKDYRGKRRTLLSLLLDWGGNCVSQTLMTVGLLQEFPQFIPSGYQLGVALTPYHMEAVLINKNEIWFLMSGAKIVNDNTITVLKPESLIVRTLKMNNAKIIFNANNFYLSGRPENNDTSTENWSLARIVKGIDAATIDHEQGLVGGLGQLFKYKDDGTPPPDVPDFAEMTFQPSANKPAQSAPQYSGGVHSRNLLSNFIGKLILNKQDLKNKPSIRTVTLGGVTFNICMRRPSSFPFCTEPNGTYLSVHAFNRDNYWVLERLSDGKLQLTMQISDDFYDKLIKMPPELWLITHYDFYLKKMHAHFSTDIPATAIERAQSYHLIAQDEEYLKPYSKFLSSKRSYASPEDLFNQLWPRSIDLEPQHKLSNPLINRMRINVKGYRFLNIITRNRIYQITNTMPIFDDQNSADHLQKYVEFLEAIFTPMIIRPEQFVTSFSNWEQNIRRRIVQLLRQDQESQQAEFMPIYVRNFLNSLSENEIQIIDFVDVPQKNCFPFAITLATGNVGYTFNPQPVCNTGQARQIKKLKKSTPQARLKIDKTRIQLDPIVLAELSLGFSGGVHLWNGAVKQAVIKNIDALEAAGIEPIELSTPQPVIPPFLSLDVPKVFPNIDPQDFTNKQHQVKYWRAYEIMRAAWQLDDKAKTARESDNLIFKCSTPNSSQLDPYIISFNDKGFRRIVIPQQNSEDFDECSFDILRPSFSSSGMKVTFEMILEMHSCKKEPMRFSRDKTVIKDGKLILTDKHFSLNFSETATDPTIPSILDGTLEKGPLFGRVCKPTIFNRSKIEDFFSTLMKTWGR